MGVTSGSLHVGDQQHREIVGSLSPGSQGQNSEGQEESWEGVKTCCGPLFGLLRSFSVSGLLATHFG